MYRFNYISADPGSGKTRWAIQQTAKLLYNNTNVLLVVPTIDLCDSISLRSSAQITAIHSRQSHIEPPTARFHAAVRAAARTNQPIALVITIQLFHRLQLQNMMNWVLIRDEATDPLQIYEIAGARSMQYLNQHYHDFVPVPSLAHTAELFQLVQLQHRAEAYEDAQDTLFHTLVPLDAALRNAHCQVLVRDPADTPGKFRFGVYEQPSLYAEFADVYFMGANFEHTFIYNCWAEAVQWHNSTPMTLGSLPSARLTIRYHREDAHWSKRYRDSANGANLQSYAAWVEAQFQNQQYVYVANNDCDLDLSGVRIPVLCHGLNDWRDYTNIALFGAFLIGHQDEAFFRHCGVSTSDARAMRQTQYYAQQLTRTDLRNYTSTRPITCLVPSLQQALDLLLYFPDAKIEDASGAQYKLRSDWELQFNTPAQPAVQNAGLCIGQRATTRAVTWIDQQELVLQDLLPAKTGRPQRSGNTLLALIIALGSDYEISVDSADFAERKLNQRWFSPGVYADGSQLTRAACLGANLLALDFDDTLISDSTVARLLPGVEYLLYTTASHLPKSVTRRMRLVIPLDRTVNTEEYRAISEYYAEQFAAAQPHHGIDFTKLDCWVKMFVPHSTSQIVWQHSRRHSLRVDRLLSQIPRLPLIKPPSANDLQCTNRAQDNLQDARVLRVQNIIAKMTQGNRTNLAMQAAGSMRMLSRDVKLELFEQIKQRGVSRQALRQVQIYAEL